MEGKHEAINHEVAPHSGRKNRGVVDKLYPPGPKPGAGGRIKNHCRKFWWCDLLVLAIILLIIVLPVIYVAIPKRAQHELDASTLEVTSQEVTAPHENGLHLRLVSTARSDSSYHPRIEAFRAGLSIEGSEPFTYLNVPEIQAADENQIIVDQDITFASRERFIEYNKYVIGAEEFHVYLDGKTKVHQSGLQGISVEYRKKVTLKGLNKLRGLTISDLHIRRNESITLLSGQSPNMIGTVNIPNPSVYLLDLGNVTMNLAIDGRPIGTTLIPNLTLRPGNNSAPMVAYVEQLAVVGAIRSKYTDGVIKLQVSGNASMVGEEHLWYFEEAMRSQVIDVDLDVGPALGELGLNITAPAAGT